MYYNDGRTPSCPKLAAQKLAHRVISLVLLNGMRRCGASYIEHAPGAVRMRFIGISVNQRLMRHPTASHCDARSGLASRRKTRPSDVRPVLTWGYWCRLSLMRSIDASHGGTEARILVQLLLADPGRDSPILELVLVPLPLLCYG